MRMGRVSWLTQQRVPPVTHTHALFAGQSHSIPDNLVALSGAVGAWHCSDKLNGFQSLIIWCTAGFRSQSTPVSGSVRLHAVDRLVAETRRPPPKLAF